MKKNRFRVNCCVCGKFKWLRKSEILNNTTGHFYCDRECMKVGHSKFYSGDQNPFYGKTHSEESMQKMTGENHWNYGNKKEKVVKTYTIICENCGIEFESTNNRRRFCSRKCSDQYCYPSKIVRPCSYCGKEVLVIPCKSDVKENVFCDQDCYALYRKFIYKQPSGPDSHWYGKRGEDTPNWRGGLSYEPYSVDFNNDIKEQVRQRDDYTCQLCGIGQNGEKLNIHHIDYDKQHNTIDNLVSLCRSCHTKTNGNRPVWTEFFKDILRKYDGATTIPKGSTLQANGSGSARHPVN